MQHDPGNGGVEALDGYRGISPSGKRIGEVVQASDTDGCAWIDVPPQPEIGLNSGDLE